MFNENKTFNYSIEVATNIYKTLITQEEANKKFYKEVELFFQEIGQEFESFEGSGVAGFGGCTYTSDKQTISVLVQFGNEPSVYGIILPTNGTYTKQIFYEGLKNKCLFGLPIFTMKWFDDMEMAFIYFMSLESYLRYNTSQGRIEKELFGF
jgi:hypothetical protein